MKSEKKTVSDLSKPLLDWYDRHQRTLPWRAPPGERQAPYKVWLSEIMLQQTTVTAVKPYFEAFTARWPTVEALAGADLDHVLTAWAGLGYYARARNLHLCAQRVAHTLGGVFPNTEAELLTLPGVGPYTAAAIAAIAFDRRAVVMDGNVERVMARLFAETAPLPGVKAKLKARAESLTPQDRCGDYAQAVMDLGATICTPRSPKCGLCPWSNACEGQERASDLPARTAKKPKPTRHGIAFWQADGGGVLLRRRPETGLLGGMMEVPSSPWREDGPWSLPEAAKAVGAVGSWRLLPGRVRHTFSHFHLELLVAVGGTLDVEGLLAADNLDDHALPSVMRKVARHAISTPQ